jgi:lysophospholipase L1-like esterase
MGCGITSGSSPSGRTWAERLSVKGVEIVNLAVAGTHAVYGAEHIDDYMQEYAPSFVMVLYGVNDVAAGISNDDIIENLEQIIQVVQYYSGQIIIGTIPIVTKYSLSEADEARSLNLQIESLCVHYGIECADVSSAMGYDDDLYLDGFHPTLEGQKYIQAAFRSKISVVMGK